MDLCQYLSSDRLIEGDTIDLAREHQGLCAIAAILSQNTKAPPALQQVVLWLGSSPIRAGQRTA